MQSRTRSSMFSNITILILFAVTAACAPKSNFVQAADPIKSTSTPLTLTPESPTGIPTSIPLPETPSQAPDWPVYNLATELPDAPAQMTLYTQAIPAGLPDQKRLAEMMEQLQITGTVSTNTTESGESEISVTGDSGSFRVASDDPYLLVIENAPVTQGSETPMAVLSAEVHLQAAEEFLRARGLLDFPYLLEPPRLSRDRDRAIRVVQLIDGYPLYDYDPLNGRLLVWFNADGEISVVFWRPLKLTAGDSVNIVPAAVAWEQLVKGQPPEGGTLGQCWQATVFDPKEPNAIAAHINSPPCVSFNSGSSLAYKAATIQDVTLVYFANDLSLGMSPFAFPADSPARIVFPMWQFYGITNDRRELIILWPAIQAS